eukprot:COSAG01_NODE_2104_length_8418_cov_94.839644_2_plen_125_part_00
MLCTCVDVTHHIPMSQPAAPSHESLPETFATKQDAIAAIKVLANTTGHRVMQSNRSSKIVTLRCWGYKTHGAASFGCAFKVSYLSCRANSCRSVLVRSYEFVPVLYSSSVLLSWNMCMYQHAAS